jgi:hypothetical protein
MTDVEQPPKVSPAAERMRRYRSRPKIGVSCVIIQLFEPQLAALVQLGFLAPTRRRDRAAIAGAMNRFLDRNPISRWR